MLPRGIGPTVDLLRVLLKYRCEEAGRGAAPDRQHRATSRRSPSTTRPTCRPCTAGAARSSATTPWRSRPATSPSRCATEARGDPARPRRRHDAALLVVGRGFIGNAPAAPALFVGRMTRRPRRDQPAARPTRRRRYGLWPAATRRLGSPGVAPGRRARADGRPPRRSRAISASSASAPARSTHRRPARCARTSRLGPTDRYGEQKLAHRGSPARPSSATA